MTPGIVILVAVALAALVLIVAVYLRRRAPDDHVDSFRRQIDALSPQARRPTIGKMNPPEPSPAAMMVTMPRDARFSMTARATARRHHGT